VRRLTQGLLPALTAPARVSLKRWVGRVFQRGDGPEVNYDQPLGDPGLFGPNSVTWRIHADFPGMMAGGVCALMLQTLHPRALAGVWDHSNFRTDILGRLRRTTIFVAATTYAPTTEAERLIARVRAIHERVVGHDERGQAYAASDPALLTWVHATEVSSFLNGYQRYRGVVVPRRLQDRYYAETSVIAEKLGAVDVPKSAAAMRRYFDAVQGELSFGTRSAEVLAVLAQMQLPIPVAGVSRHLFLGAGAALLPDWARTRMPRTTMLRLRDEAAARGLYALAPVLRAALRDGIGARSCRRMGLELAALQQL